jgi:alkanesulfonate monooxygenase SsuD/methylene tetrahydromethanopterin reductase-like flavin-dependent oxidoreductase (luciferase family)
MKFGVFYEWPNPQVEDWKGLFEQGIEQIQLAEEAGFDFVLIAEHHFSNYGMSPAPLLQALAIAERTRRIRIATSVLVLPVWNPLRLAEEVAVLDNLTGGRFICGIGRGYQPHELSRYGVALEDSRGVFLECLDILQLAWRSDTSFTYQGRYLNVPHETVVWPKPLQKPYPPLWVAGSSGDTLQLAAERDMVPIVPGFGGPDAVRRSVLALLQARSAAGRPEEQWELGAQTMALVAGSEAEARAAAGYARWQNRAGRALNRLDVFDGRVRAVPYEGELDDERYFGSLCYGTPDRVREKYRALAEAGATFASCWMMVGGIPHERIMKSIRLMGSEVLPALRDVRPLVPTAEEIGSDGKAAAAEQPQAPSG